MSFAVVKVTVTQFTTDLNPLVCGNVTRGQWYGPTGSILQDSSANSAGGYGQFSGQGGAELYAGTFYQASGGVHCCANTTVTLCITLFADPVLANSSNLATVNPAMHALSIAAASKHFLKGGGPLEGILHTTCP